MDEYAGGFEPEITFRKYAAGRGADPASEEAAAIVSFLEGLAGAGPVMELGVGTGRIALPLASRGIRVDGVEISTPVVERLRKEPGGDQLSVTVGNFADVEYPDRYSLIYVVANALLNLYSQEDQIRCFNNVYVTLGERGVEMFPIVQRYVWPSGIDLMARIAGLTLQERWGGWRREPFGSDSKVQVAVYGR